MNLDIGTPEQLKPTEKKFVIFQKFSQKAFKFLQTFHSVLKTLTNSKWWLLSH